MAFAEIKKVIRIGGSLAIILPCKWTKENVKVGQEMVLVGNGELRIIPLRQKETLQDGENRGEDQQT